LVVEELYITGEGRCLVELSGTYFMSSAETLEMLPWAVMLVALIKELSGIQGMGIVFCGKLCKKGVQVVM